MIDFFIFVLSLLCRQGDFFSLLSCAPCAYALMLILAVLLITVLTASISQIVLRFSKL
jgi:hypothetical protein